MKRLLGLAVVLSLLGGGLFAVIRVRPLYVYEAAVAWKLRLAGVRTRRIGELDFLMRDERRRGSPARCVVLIHGLGDSASTWRRLLADETDWQVPSGSLLAAPQMPGTEGSAPPRAPEDYTIPSQARILKSALAAVCPRWTVVGNSLGGWTASWLALQWPEGVQRLVLLSPAGLRDPSGVSVESARQLAEPTVEVVKVFLKKTSHTPRFVPEAAWPEMVERLRERPNKAILKAVTEDHFLDGKLAAITAPTVVLWGESDGVIPATQAPRFQAEMPKARVEILPACGHLPQAECPGPVRAAIAPESQQKAAKTAPRIKRRP